MINATSQPALNIPQAAGTTTPSMSSYLATLAGNAQLAAAAASISPHTTAPIMIGVPTPQQHQSRPVPAAPLVQQQLNPTMNNITPTVSTTTTAGALPAVNWPMVFQGISQAGIGSTTAE